MAALYGAYTLCGIVPSQNLTSAGLHGIKSERDQDHVLVTDSTRSVTLYKVSDQKPLCSWTVKQGQSLTCPVTYNSITKEYVAVSDHKIIRIWKEDEITLEKAFKATVSSDVWQVHSAPGADPVVLFRRGAVRLLDSILAAPQQTVEDVLAQDEILRWSTNLIADSQHFVIFTTEQKGDHFLYLQRLNPNSLQKYSLEREEPGLSPLSFCVALRDKHIFLLYLYPNGHVYQSMVLVRGVGADDGTVAHTLPRSLVLSLSVGDGLLDSASALILDDAHVAFVGVPHPSAGASKDFLCIWNIHFQTLQAGKEMAGTIYGQVLRFLWVSPYPVLMDSRGNATRSVVVFRNVLASSPRFPLLSTLNADRGLYNFGRSQTALHRERALWSFSNKLFIPHGKSLSVIRYECPKSCLASALGKMRQAKSEDCKGPSSVPSWSSLLHGEKVPQSRKDSRKIRSLKTKSERCQSIEQMLELIKTGPVEEVQPEVEAYVAKLDTHDLQLIVGRLSSALVCRSSVDLSFYTGSLLSQLVQSRTLCHSLCPDLVLLTLEKRDYFLCQICLQFFPDIPEAITCTCLKAFISMTDGDSEIVQLEPASVSFMQTLISKDNAQPAAQNGCSPTSDKTEINEGDGMITKINRPLKDICPVSLNKAVLLNQILQTPYSENCLLPHIKDLSSHHAIVFLRYLQFLYLKYSQDALPQRKQLRAPTFSQVMDWVCLVLDAHFTVLVMTPEARELLLHLHTFVKSQVKLFSELGKIESSLEEINKMRVQKDIGQYSIEVLELY